MNCKKCEEVITEESKFCGSCGEPVDKEVQSESEVVNEPTPVKDEDESGESFSIKDVLTDEQKEAAKEAAKEVADTAKIVAKEVSVVAKDTAKEAAKEAAVVAKDVTEKVKKMPPKKLAMLGAGAVALIVLAMTMFGEKTIDVTEFVSAEFSGYEDAGRVGISLDEYVLIDEIFANMKNSNVDSSYYVYEAIDAITLKFDVPDELDNGDKVKVEVIVNEDRIKNLGVKLKGGDMTFKAEGLEEVEDIDPFDYITVEFTGISPNINATIKYDTESNARMSAVRGQLSKTSGIVVGEELVLTLNDVEESQTKKNGYVLEETEKTFKCENVDKYVESVDEIDEKYTAKFEEVASDELEAYFVSNDLAYNGLKYEGMYVLTAKENNWRMGLVYVVLSAEISSDSKGIASTKLYFPMEMQDVVLTAEGEYIYNNSATLPAKESGIALGWSSVVGYADVDYMYQKIVTANKNLYNWDATKTLIAE